MMKQTTRRRTRHGSVSLNTSVKSMKTDKITNFAEHPIILPAFTQIHTTHVLCLLTTLLPTDYHPMTRHYSTTTLLLAQVRTLLPPLRTDLRA